MHWCNIYLCNTQCSVTFRWNSRGGNPDCLVLPSSNLPCLPPLRTMQKVQGKPSAISCTSNSSGPCLFTSPYGSGSFVLFTNRYTVLSDAISRHKIEVTSLSPPPPLLSPGALYALLFLLGKQTVICVFNVVFFLWFWGSLLPLAKWLWMFVLALLE